MLSGIFVVQLDDMHGFLVKKRHPQSMTLSEGMLNMVWYEHQQAKKTLKKGEYDSKEIISFSVKKYPEWLVCFLVEGTESEETPIDDSLLMGMGRLILELMHEAPDKVELHEIIEKKSTLKGLEDEQKYAEVYTTPSTSLLLEKIQEEGLESAAKLAVWLKRQIQSDDLDIREVVAPLLRSGIVRVELVGKTSETVFLVKDIFGYRAPPVGPIEKVKIADPVLSTQYEDLVSSFFSPKPPERGYNPTIPSDDPNSPILEDRKVIARIISNRMHYPVIKCLREQPSTIEQISASTAFPQGVVEASLKVLERHRIAELLDDGLWVLVTDPIIESFMPEYVIPIVSAKLAKREISTQAVRMYMDLLIQTWSE